jgi:hypothetical protein
MAASLNLTHSVSLFWKVLLQSFLELQRHKRAVFHCSQEMGSVRDLQIFSECFLRRLHVSEAANDSEERVKAADFTFCILF